MVLNWFDWKISFPNRRNVEASKSTTWRLSRKFPLYWELTLALSDSIKPYLPTEGIAARTLRMVRVKRIAWDCTVKGILSVPRFVYKLRSLEFVLLTFFFPLFSLVLLFSQLSDLYIFQTLKCHLISLLFCSFYYFSKLSFSEHFNAILGITRRG